jgi:cell wall-associated NlpC family hydrolase
VSVSTTRARHRAARRPVTPLTDFANAATGSMQVVSRRTAVVAASSGLVVSMMTSPASAAPSSETASMPSVDTAALTASARAVLATAPVVTAPADAAWSFEVAEVTAVAPVVKKAPKPKPERTSTSSSSASRSSTRSAMNNPIPASVSGNAVLEVAARYVGVPYRSGGTSPIGFDCSGFVQYVYAQLGVSLPRSSSAYRSIGTVVSRADAQPGDIIWSPGHVAIYAGGNMQIDSPRPGKTIQFRAIWQSNPVFIRVT